MEFNIKEFDPLKAEIHALVDNVKATVASSTGAVGLELLKENQRVLQKERTRVDNYFKEKREPANAYATKCIETSKDLISIITEVESPLKEKIEVLNKEEEKKKRLKFLPDRKERLAAIEFDLTSVTDDFLLEMGETPFNEFVNEKRAAYLQAKEDAIKAAQEAEATKLRAAQDKLLEDQRQLDEAKRIVEATKKAEEDARLKAIEDIKLAKEQAEADKIKAVEEAKLQAEREKQAIIDAQKKVDDARIAAELKDIKEKQEKERLEKEAQEKLEKQKKYQKWLKDNEYDEKTDKLVDFVSGVGLYRKVSEFIK